MKKLFGTDGIRGEANVELTPEIAFLAGFYSALVLSEDSDSCKVVIGKDTRESCDMLECAFISGALSMGADVLSVGIVPTPAIPQLIKEYKANLGVMISASHNPFEFNGIKLFNKNGYKLRDRLEEKIETLIQQRTFKSELVSSKKIGRLTKIKDAYKIYKNHIIASCKLNLKGYKIALDCANGSNYIIAPELLRELGAEVIAIGTEPDGKNINKECGSTHLEKLQDLTKNSKANIGIAFDGDADRMLALDENGDLIDGDKILLAFAKKLKKQNKLNNSTVVATVMSNLSLENALKAEGIDLVRTKVGDRYVLEKMLDESYSLGGEQSGHIIMSEVNTTGDGLFSAIKLLEILKDDIEKASDINKSMSLYPQILINLNVPNSIKYEIAEVPEIKEKILKLERELGNKGRVLLRASGTEPKLRVMLEGIDNKLIEKPVNELAVFIKNLVEEHK